MTTDGKAETDHGDGLSVCVFCGSRTGRDPDHARAAEELGRGIARRGWTLVYGAGSIGLMGILARAALAAGGHVIGIIPHHLERLEVALHEIDELVLVDTMHERKAAMFARADVFVVLPGGIGTLDEFVEMTTWAQLGLHDKPILLVDLNGYFRALRDHLEHLVREGFADRETLRLFETLPDMNALWRRLESLAAPPSHDLSHDR